MPKYLDIEASLDGVKSRIWRRFLLRERATFLERCAGVPARGLRRSRTPVAGRTPSVALRDANGQVVAGMPDNFGFDEPDPDAAKVPAADYLKRHWQMRYEYDFGDSWEH